MKQYKIFLRDKAIGTVSVETDGLYTRFLCKCSFPDDRIYRIVADFGPIQTDLGVCIPQGECFVTKAKIPSKRINDQTPNFFAIPSLQADFAFVEIDPKNAFPYLSDLSTAKFSIQEGKRGLLIHRNS